MLDGVSPVLTAARSESVQSVESVFTLCHRCQMGACVTVTNTVLFRCRIYPETSSAKWLYCKDLRWRSSGGSRGPESAPLQRFPETLGSAKRILVSCAERVRQSPGFSAWRRGRKTGA